MSYPNNLVTSVMMNGNQRVEQAILNSTRHREILKNNLNANPNVQPLEVIVESNEIKQTIYVNPYIDYQKIQQTVIKPSIVQKTRIHLEPIEGILLKKSPHFIMGYAKKYCILKNRTLQYYHPEQRDKLEGSLNFDLQEYTYTPITNNQGITIEFKLVPNGCKKEFIFKSEIENDTNRWAAKIQMHLVQSEGKYQKLTKLSQTEKFWKHHQDSYSQIEDLADDGDILLFRTKDTFSSAARMVMGSEFDHVAICYREDGKLWVYEAVQSGVGTFLYCNLKFQDWYKYYEKICFRKLNYAKKQQYREKFINFIKNNLGNEYSLHITKFFQFQSKIVTQKTQQNETNTEEKKRSYFCSELVAKAFKEMELLDPIKSSTQYHPIDFTSARQLKLLNNASLGPEQLIIFEV